eukprot:CAMPEP_0113667548 /NCGR_PEP_ID=MMETSP0038_2-20120614/3499_1 /TAXON_ID=2898 /ORGANISM="Cryptomonas paramecium" /LENGTH=58 /DNA_ID=CAMNT_0000583179 /DNA_START=532 /DNA_END=704 /DNA_ORIENTATION=- /assembly_acc=CAM_ASM_000170
MRFLEPSGHDSEYAGGGAKAIRYSRFPQMELALSGGGRALQGKPGDRAASVSQHGSSP